MSEKKEKKPDVCPEKEAAAETGAAKPARTSRKKRIDSKRLLRRLTVTAVCTAFAVVLKSFTNIALNIPGLGIKIGLGGIFNFFPAALCGPLYGGAASALTDLLGVLIAPDGAYIPWLTVTAFLGGCGVGLLWKFLNRRASRSIRAVLLSVFSVILLFGVSANISLCRDGIMSGVLAKQSSLPYREEIEAADLSPISKFITGLSRYSSDSKNLSLLSHPASEGITELPATVTVDGTERKVTSISSGALENISGIVIIPASYTSIPDSAAGDNSSLTVAGTAGSAAEDFAKAANLNFLDLKKDELPAIEYSTPELDGLTAADSHSPIEWDGYSFGQSDTYRKNLASNTNIVVLGSELAGVCGILFILLNLLLTSLPGKKRSAEANGDTPAAESRAFSFLKIAVAVTVSGLFVTIVNTFILRAFLPAWSDRELVVLLIPRIAEELIVRLLQAYIISLLYGAVSTGKAGNILKKLQ